MQTSRCRVNEAPARDVQWLRDLPVRCCVLTGLSVVVTLKCTEVWNYSVVQQELTWDFKSVTLHKQVHRKRSHWGYGGELDKGSQKAQAPSCHNVGNVANPALSCRRKPLRVDPKSSHHKNQCFLFL